MFKKCLSMLLAIVMTLSCMTAVAIDAVATDATPTGTPITSLSQISDKAGDYYLATDIVSNNTTVSGTFTGTLDGNGKTITTSVPLFNDLGAGAEVKNLTTAGTLTTTEVNYGVVAKTATGAFTMTNCTNNANITYTVSGTDHVHIGGFVGKVTAGGVTMTNCTNNGNISISAKNTAKQARVGGLIGYNEVKATTPVTNATYTGCINYGTIRDNSSFSLLGGLIGFYSNAAENYTFNACKNFGAITGGDMGGKVGGLIGVSDKNNTHNYIDCHNNAVISSAKNIVGGLVGQDGGAFTFNGCTNKGEVKRTEYVSQGVAIGGIIAYASAAATHNYIDCVNEANLTAPYLIGGIVGDDRGTLTMKGCQNKGNITGPQGSTVYANMGGMVGQQLGAFPMFMENCSNEGKIDIKTTNKTKLAGGMVGRSENAADRTFINCTNSGSISVDSGGKLGGMAGCIGDASTGTSTFIGCVNSGAIVSHIYAGGMIGNERGTVKFISCINDATMNISSAAIDSNTCAAGMVAFDQGNVTAYSCFNYGRLTNNHEPANVATIANNVVVAQYCESAEVDRMPVEFVGVQRSVEVANETTFSLRFVSAVSNTKDYSATGFLVYRATSGSSAVGFTTLDTNTVYEQLIEIVDDEEKVIYPAEQGKYFSALAVRDIPVNGTYSFIIVPYMVALDGETMIYAGAITTLVSNGRITSCYDLAQSAGNAATDQAVTLAGNDLSDYRIVYETERDGYQTIAQQLQSNLLAMGYNLPVVPDTAAIGAKEILIGKTNRTTSQTLYATHPDLMTYSVVIGDSYLQLLSGGPYSASVAVDAICSKFTTANNKSFASGELLSGDLNIKDTSIAAGADLRIMTSNVLAGVWASSNTAPVVQRAEIYAATLVSSKPDVIGVQETDMEWIEILPYYLTFIKERYNVEYEWIFEDWKSDRQIQSGVSHGQTRTSMLYRSDKYTIEDSGIENIAAWTSTLYNIRLFEWALFSEKTNPEHQFIVCNTHWSHSGESATWQAQCLDLCINGIRTLQAQYANVPIFHTGDYNSNNDSGTDYTNFLATLGAFDAMLKAKEKGVRVNDCGGCAPVGMWRGANGSYIDHIACFGSNIEVLRFETLIGRNIYCTDHLPQIADFNLW